MQTTSTPVASGSSVPACPTRGPCFRLAVTPCLFDGSPNSPDDIVRGHARRLVDDDDAVQLGHCGPLLSPSATAIGGVVLLAVRRVLQQRVNPPALLGQGIVHEV